MEAVANGRSGGGLRTGCRMHAYGIELWHEQNRRNANEGISTSGESVKREDGVSWPHLLRKW